MQNLKERYIRIYNQQKQEICSNSIELLNKERDFAFEQFSSMGFPSSKSENYAYTNIKKAFDKEYSFSTSSSSQLSQNSIPKIGLEETPHHRITLLNGKISPELSSNNLLSEQSLYIGSLINFIKEHPDKEPLIDKIYGKYAEADIDSLVALNTLFSRDVLLFFIPKDTDVKEPINLLQLTKIDRSSIFFNRILILVEKNASVNFVFSEKSLEKKSVLNNLVVEINVEEGAKLQLTSIEETNAKHISLNTFVLRQKKFSNVLLNTLTLNNGITRNNFWTRFKDKDAFLNLSGLALGIENQIIDNYTHIGHLFPDCTTEELFKYILDDKAIGAFAGRIFVSANAEKTNANQNNRNLLLSPSAKIYSKPQLEIYADDVKCSHGMTTGQLSEEALFYLRQRGVSLKEARNMLSVAFTNDILELIPITSLKEYVAEFILNKFSKH